MAVTESLAGNCDRLFSPFYFMVFIKGQIAWNKTNLWKECIVCKKNFRAIPSRFKLVKCCSFECVNLNKKGLTPWNKGVKWSEEHKEKLRKPHIIGEAM